jgi:hypothetical protein
MPRKLELKIENLKTMYNEIVLRLLPFREENKQSIEFVVEGNKDDPMVAVRYPGQKVKKRHLKGKRKDSAEWQNLFDFVVVPYINGQPGRPEDFTFERLLEDFQENKKQNEEFWECIKKIYYENKLTKKPPKLKGIESKTFLLTLKWTWIQEDLNYKYSWQDVKSPIKYVRVSKRGKIISSGAGRAKSFAALILIKSNFFSFEEVKKIIPPYG